MQRTNKLIWIATILTMIILSGCSVFWSKEKRAQQKLGKAVQLDPSILQSTLKDSVVIKDSVNYLDSVRIKDSVNIVTKDSTIIIPKSDLNGTIEDPCDDVKGLQPFDYSLGSGVHKLHIWSDGKKIRYTSTVDSLVSTIKSKDTYVSSLETQHKLKEQYYLDRISSLEKKVVTVVKYKPTTWQVLKIAGISGLIFLIIGYLIAKFTKFKLPFIG